MLSEVSQTENERQHLRKFLKLGRRIVLLNMQNVAISRCCFVTVCKQQRRNEQRIITHVYTAIEFVTEIMNSQTSTKQTKARPTKKTAETAENISSMKRNQNI